MAEGLLYRLVLLPAEREEVAFEHLFVNGTKIEANRYSFVWAKSTNQSLPRHRLGTRMRKAQKPLVVDLLRLEI